MPSHNRADLERGKGESLPLSFVGESAALRALEVRVLRGDRLVLDGVSLSVEPGQHVCLTGPNGSGKSTLLLALKGVLTVSDGEVRLGRWRVRELEPKVGLVLANPEDQGVCPTVEDDVAFGLENRNLPPEVIRREVTEALDMVGLLELRSALVHTLSGGQAQKLALAAVLALGADFLLLDEATSMLSPWERDDLMLTLHALRRRGLGVLHVTHQGEELLWADRVVALRAGHVEYDGKPSDYFRWTGCPGAAPSLACLAQDVAAEGGTLPSFPELVRWVGVGTR